MRKYLSVFLLLASHLTYSQVSNKEFEGVITYKTTIVLKDQRLDSNELYKVFGRERLYYFKAGSFKWVPKNVKLEYEIFNPSISRSYLFDKYHSNDTLFYKDMNEIPDSVTSVHQSRTMRILNIPCVSTIFTVTNEKKHSSISRTIYYSKDTLLYANSYFDNFKAMGQNFISSYTNSIPLRMEMDSEKQPFYIIYEAVNLQWKQLLDSEFQIDNTLPVKK